MFFIKEFPKKKKKRWTSLTRCFTSHNSLNSQLNCESVCIHKRNVTLIWHGSEMKLVCLRDLFCSRRKSHCAPCYKWSSLPLLPAQHLSFSKALRSKSTSKKNLTTLLLCQQCTYCTIGGEYRINVLINEYQTLFFLSSYQTGIQNFSSPDFLPSYVPLYS